MNAEKTILVGLGCAILGAGALVLVAYSQDRQITPSTDPNEKLYVYQPPDHKAAAAMRYEAGRQKLLDRMIAQQTQQLKSQGATQNLRFEAMKRVFGDSRLIVNDDIRLLKRIATQVDQGLAIAFFDTLLQANRQKVHSGLKSHALSYLAAFATEDAQDAIVRYVERFDPKALPLDENALMEMNNVIIQVNKMGVQAKSVSAVNTAEKILSDIVLNPDAGFPQDLRRSAVQLLGGVPSERGRALLLDLAMEQKRLPHLEFSPEDRSDMARAAIYALGRFEDAQAVEAIKNVGQVQTDPNLRLAAIGVLGDLGSLEKPLYTQGAFRSRVKKDTPPSDALRKTVVDSLQTIYEQEQADPKVRGVVIRKLGRINSPESIEALTALLKVEGESEDSTQIRAILDSLLGLNRAVLGKRAP